MDLFNILLGILSEKVRDSLDDQLKGGSTTEEYLRNIIRREIKEIQDTLTDLARKDLLSAVSFTNDGLVALENYESTGEEASLLHAIECFNQSIVWSTHAFENNSLSTQDRVLATKIKVTSTLMKLRQSPDLALTLSVDCFHKLCDLKAVRKVFKQEFGWKKVFSSGKVDDEIRNDVSAVKRGIRELVLSNTSSTNLTWPMSTWHPSYFCVDFLTSDDFQFHFISLDSDQNLVAMHSYQSLVRVVNFLTSDVIKEFQLKRHTDTDRHKFTPVGLICNPRTKSVFVALVKGSKLEVQIRDHEGEFINSLEIQLPQILLREGVETAVVGLSDERVIVASRNHVWVISSDIKRVICSKEFERSVSFNGCVVIQEEIYLCDSFNNRIVVLNLALEKLRQFGQKGSEKGDFQEPRGITHDHVTGHIFICDRDNHRVQIFTKEGQYIQKIKVIPEWFPDQVVVTSQGYVLVRCFNPDSHQHKVLLVK